MRRINVSQTHKKTDTSKIQSNSTKNEDVVKYNPKKTWDDLTPKTTLIKATIPSKDYKKAENYQFKVKTEGLQKFNYELSTDEKNIVKNVIVSNLKQNKMTPGTQKMMENEKFHAIEAIESGIYVNWTTKVLINLQRKITKG